jgi:hypothetical protein
MHYVEVQEAGVGILVELFRILSSSVVRRVSKQTLSENERRTGRTQVRFAIARIQARTGVAMLSQQRPV